jgi:hypothetical protein
MFSGEKVFKEFTSNFIATKKRREEKLAIKPLWPSTFSKPLIKQRS